MTRCVDRRQSKGSSHGHLANDLLPRQPNADHAFQEDDPTTAPQPKTAIPVDENGSQSTVLCANGTLAPAHLAAFSCENESNSSNGKARHNLGNDDDDNSITWECCGSQFGKIQAIQRHCTCSHSDEIYADLRDMVAQALEIPEAAATTPAEEQQKVQRRRVVELAHTTRGSSKKKCSDVITGGDVGAGQQDENEGEGKRSPGAKYGLSEVCAFPADWYMPEALPQHQAREGGTDRTFSQNAACFSLFPYLSSLPSLFSP